MNDLKIRPSKRTRLTYVAYYQSIGVKKGHFLAIIRHKIGPILPEKSAIRCTKQATYKTVAWVACRVLPDNKGVQLEKRAF